MLARIESREFRCSEGLCNLLEKIRNKQLETYLERKKLMMEIFEIPVDRLSSNHLRWIEEALGMLNDRNSEECDSIFVELKEHKDTLIYKGDSMLNQLRTELELYDARIEWGEHESCKSLIDVDIKPHLIKCQRFVDKLAIELSSAMQTLDEQAHHACLNLTQFLCRIATNVETFKTQKNELVVKHQGEIDDCKEDHKDECENNENEMLNYKAKIEDCVHHPDLDVLLEETFTQLDTIATSYRDYATNLLTIHRDYEPEICEFFRATTDNFIPSFGLKRLPDKDSEEDEEEPPSPPPEGDT